MNLGHAGLTEEGLLSPAQLRRRARVLVLSACAVLCACLAWSASASALAHRGHVFGSTFAGSGEAAFGKVGGIAVNEATGEVYVVDTSKERVERFKPDGSGGFEFVAAIAVPNPQSIAIDNAAASPSLGDVYVAGVNKATKKGEEPETERNFIYKFTATGEKIYKKELFKTKEKIVNEAGELENEEFIVETENLNGLAVDATGKLWADWEAEGYVAAFSSAETNKLIGTSIKESALTEEQPPALQGFLECPARPGFAVAPNDEFLYVAHEQENSLEQCFELETSPVVVAKLKESGEAVAAELGTADTRGVAVDSANGDVYLDNVSSVLALTSDGSTIQRFGSEHLTGGSAIAVNSESGAFAGTRGDVFVAEEGKVTVFIPESEAGAPTVDSVFAQNLTPESVRLGAKIDPKGSDTHYFFQYGTVSCVTQPSSCTDVPAAPGADLGAGFGDQSVETVLTGLQPNTVYYYRVLAQNEHGKGESSQTASTFFVTLPSAEGLLADHREWEMLSPPTKGGVLEAATNQGPAAIQASESGDALAYGTPNSAPSGEAEGNRSIAVTPFLFTRGEAEWTEQNLSTPHNKGENFDAGAQLPEYRVFSSDLALSIVEPESGTRFPIEEPPLAPPLKAGEVQEKTIYVRANPPLAPAPAEAKLYAEAAANREYLAPGYLALVTQVNDTAGNPFGVALAEQGQGNAQGFANTTPDLQHVVFKSPVPLTTGAVGEGLYEWNAAESAHGLHLVSVLPGGEPALEPTLGGHAISRNAISTDGSRIVYTSASGPEGSAAGFLMLRDTATGKTTQLDAVQGEHVAEPTAEERAEESLVEPHFNAASADGSRIFFTDTWPLTDSSNLHPSTGVSVNPADLYEFNTSTGKLADLTVSARAGEFSEVLGTIPGVSEDGSYVYFVANGALTTDAKRGNCPKEGPEAAQPGAECNLYVSEPDPNNPAVRRTKLIARLSADDAPDWAQGINTRSPSAAEAGDLIYLTSRVSPHGRYLAFMSDRSLTGYDNEDTSSNAPGERVDEEVYLFDSTSGRLSCASCNPSGERPTGVFESEKTPEGAGLLMDRSLVWQNKWLAASVPGWTPGSVIRATYQSRYLSDEGRLFFNGADALVPQDKNTKVDVYEFEQPGSGTCESDKVSGCIALISSGSAVDERSSAFLDASVSGNDVFFLTSERLLPQDYDTAFDIYDARVCGTSESAACLPVKSPPPPPCTGEACKPAPSPQPDFSSSGTATYTGPGNTVKTGVLGEQKKVPAKPKPLTRPQKLSKALKACRKQFAHKKKKKASCEKQARKRYGAKNAKKSKKSKAHKSRAARSTSIAKRHS